MNTSNDSTKAKRKHRRSEDIRKRRRGENELARDRRRIADMYLQGEIQADIAETLNISQSTVSRHLQELQAEWLAASLMDLNAAKAKELAKLDQLEREYRAAWKRSQQDAETRTVEKLGVVTDEKNKIIGNRVKQVDKKEGQTGDPRFLEGVWKCIDKRCEILGLNAPKKTDLTSDNKPIAVSIYIPDNQRENTS